MGEKRNNNHHSWTLWPHSSEAQNHHLYYDSPLQTFTIYSLHVWPKLEMLSLFGYWIQISSIGEGKREENRSPLSKHKLLKHALAHTNTHIIISVPSYLWKDLYKPSGHGGEKWKEAKREENKMWRSMLHKHSTKTADIAHRYESGFFPFWRQIIMLCTLIQKGK